MKWRNILWKGLCSFSCIQEQTSSFQGNSKERGSQIGMKPWWFEFCLKRCYRMYSIFALGTLESFAKKLYDFMHQPRRTYWCDKQKFCGPHQAPPFSIFAFFSEIEGKNGVHNLARCQVRIQTRWVLFRSPASCASLVNTYEWQLSPAHPEMKLNPKQNEALVVTWWLIGCCFQGKNEFMYLRGLWT